MKSPDKLIRQFLLTLITASGILWPGLNSVKGQSVGISSSAITADASSILELRTNTKGLLIPRMTTTERDAISSPATGLMVYNTSTGRFNYYTGAAWTALFSGTTGINSITGTSNRISIGGTSSDPVIDIASGYIGQSSITTLGTIGTGTWNGTLIDPTYGGTGVNNGTKTITLGGNLTTSGNFATTLTSTAATNITLPATGTLATLAGTETLTNKTINGLNNTITNIDMSSLTGTLGVTNGGTGTTSLTGIIKGNGTAAFSAATAGTDYSAGTAALATGIVKSTTSTGALSIAVAADFPTLNQNTTGSAATLTTARLIHGGSFNGSGDVTNIIASTYGGTGNGFAKFSGPATSEKTFTLPNANATILTDNAAVTVAQGGTGQTSYTDGQLLIGNSTGNTLTKSTLTAGTGITITNAGGSITIANASPSSGGTVTSASVVSANGFAGTVANASTTPAITLSTTVNGVIKGNGTAISAATAGTDYSAGTAALATGIVKSTTSTGALSIAVAADFPTLNQNTTGSAATLTTARNIYGNSFNGSADLTQVIASTYGGTGNGFAKFSGPATSEKTFTLPNANATILTDNAAVTVAQGGTGQTSYTDGQLLIGNSTGNTLTKSTLTAGTGITITNAGGSITIANASPSSGGTVTNVAALTLGTSGTDLSSTVANGTTTPVITLNVPTASASNRGALSSTDWSTFNSKESALTFSTGLTRAGNTITVNTSQNISTLSNLTSNGLIKTSGGTGALSIAGAGTDYSAGTAALATGIVKSTTSTGALSIAVAADFPTLNQNTTGSAATLTTARNIYGNSFNGSADLTQIIASTYGGTGNGFAKFSGPATSEKTFTLPNASANILTDNAAVTAAQGGTGNSSYTVGDLLYASASTTLSKLADVATGNALISGGTSAAPTWGKIGLTTHVTGTLPIANGGTNSTATPTAGGIVYGDGSAHQVTAAGTAGQVLQSNGSSAPTWTNGGTMMLTGVSNNTAVNNATNYFPITGAIAGATSDAQAGLRNLVSRSGTVKNLYVIISPALASGKTGTVTVMKNGVATSLVATLSVGPISFSDLTDSFTVAAGDELGIKVTTTGNVKFSWAVDFTY